MFLRARLLGSGLSPWVSPDGREPTGSADVISEIPASDDRSSQPARGTGLGSTQRGTPSARSGSSGGSAAEIPRRGIAVVWLPCRAAQVHRRRREVHYAALSQYPCDHHRPIAARRLRGDE